jgi:NAD+-processing family protein with receiver domain
MLPDTVLSVVTVLVDDLRSFRDGRDAVVARSSAAALAVIRDLGDRFVDELWLDHDLGGDNTIRPVSAHLEEIAYFGKPMRVGVIYVHSANAGAAEAVLKGLIR